MYTLGQYGWDVVRKNVGLDRPTIMDKNGIYYSPNDLNNKYLFEHGVPFIGNGQEFMLHGPGKYYDPYSDTAITGLFNANGIYMNGVKQVDTVVSITDYYRDKNREGMLTHAIDTYRNVLDNNGNFLFYDYVGNLYVYGRTGVKITDGYILIDKDGNVSSIRNLTVKPIADNFDFDQHPSNS